VSDECVVPLAAFVHSASVVFEGAPAALVIRDPWMPWRSWATKFIGGFRNFRFLGSKPPKKASAAFV